MSAARCEKVSTRTRASLRIIYTLRPADPAWIEKDIRKRKISLKNKMRPSVIPRWTAQEIPIIPLAVENVIAMSRHAAYWPSCVLKKTCSCV